MKRLFMLGSLLTALALPTGVLAQEEEGQLVEVGTWKVHPSSVAQFEGVVQKVVEAAGQAGLTNEFGWLFWSDAFTYTLVSFQPNMASFDDSDERWMRQFEGTPGEATLQEAFAEMASVRFQVLSNEVVEAVPDWSYEPEMASWPPGFAEVAEVWVTAGKDEEFDALAKEYVSVLKDIGYPYQVAGHRVRFGNTGRVVFVTFYDTRENFYGKNDFDQMVMSKGAGEKYQEIIGKFLMVVDDFKSSHIAYRTELSYWPEQ